MRLFNMIRLIAWRVIALSVALILSGCASWQRADSSVAIAQLARTNEEQSCIDWLSRLDAAIALAGTADAEAMRLPGFPHLRVNRFLASFRDELDSTQKWADWVRRLQHLDAERHTVEISNLPVSALSTIATDRVFAVTRMGNCGDLLANADLISPARLSTLRDLAIVPDDYSLWQRVAGIYPLVRIPFLSGVQGWQQSALDTFARMRIATPLADQWQEYAIARDTEPDQLSNAIPQLTRRDALGIPVVDAQSLQSLLRSYAPIFNIETTGVYDRFGALTLKLHNANSIEDSPEARVDIASPAIYVRHDFTRYGKMTLLQLTYTAWFPERPADGKFDLLSGKLDGVMVRMTFAPNGELVLVDSAHACGCYHLFFPSFKTIARTAINTLEESAFVPASLPSVEAGQRLRVWVAARTHYLVRLDAAKPAMPANEFLLTSNEAMLSTGENVSGNAAVTRSLYQPDGLVQGSVRGERFFFWPMGIASAGQMRQWGHHATAFVGRRHFDDAHLIEKYFEIPFPATR